MNELRCTHCGTVGLQPGYVEDTGQASYGFVRWVPGFLQRGALGTARARGLPRWQVDAFRCPHCAHLELFAANQA